MIRTLLLLLLLATSSCIFAQQKPDQQLPLNDLSAFQPQAGNWSVVGGILMDPTMDIHAPRAIEVGEAYEVEVPVKKKKRKRKQQPMAMVGPALAFLPEPVTFTPGSGILLNMNNDTIRDNLLTKFEHGDILLELDVMIPKGSNSGIYLQGRYEVQLLDSWGVAHPKYGDIGGIYRNWESEKGKIYMGKAPLTNAAKAPGLWQHFSIAFRAPRFDKAGKKTENARFMYVDLNGIRIHENLEVPLPTGGPVKNNEVPFGPLMIQGDHGPVAFRNISYQLLEEQHLSVKDISYAYFPGPVDDFAALQAMEPTAKGALPYLTVLTGNPTDQFGTSLQGVLVAPKAGTYSLRLNYNGQAQIEIGGKSETNSYRSGGQKYFTVDLKQGDNPFTLLYYKNDGWVEPALGLFDVGSFPEPLNAYESFPTTSRQAPPINVEVSNEPRLLRAFLDFDRDRNRRLTHTIGVGTPGGTHFIYDLKAGNPVCVWRGDFINATPMWNSRGDGSFRPRGAAQFLFTGPAVAQLAGPDAPFPAMINEFGDLQGKGYRLENQLPIFLYSRDSLQLEDRIQPDESGHALSRTISFKNAAIPDGYYAKLAQGGEIQQLYNGIYLIDQQYYIKVTSGQEATIRTQDGRQELVVPLSATALTYDINW